MRRLIGFVKDFILSADTISYSKTEDKKKSILLNLFLYLYLLIGLIMLFIETAKQQEMQVYIIVASFVMGLIMFYFYKVKKKLALVTFTFVLILTLLSIYFIIQGEDDLTGIIFTLFLPLPSILLLGRKKGTIVIALFIVITTSGFLFLDGKYGFPEYNLIHYGRSLVVFLLIFISAFSNEFVFDVFYRRQEKLSESLIISQQRYKNLAVNKEKFVSLVSHSLKDHIGSFAALANVLSQDYDEIDDKKRRQLIQDLSNVSQQNYKLMNDLLNWSTVQNEYIPFVPKPVKLEKIYRDVVDLFQLQIEEKKLSFFLKMKSNSRVFADEDMLGAILRNLVSNAIKFSKEGGEVQISAFEEDDKMVVTVTDDGLGISEMDLLRINSDVSFSNAGTMVERGAGIGLILTREFLQKNRGTFHVESELGKGTSVRIALPLAE